MSPEDFSAAVATVYRALPRTDQTTATPVLLLITGLPGTGKSFLARKIAERLPCTIVESDLIRKTLFPQPTYRGAESALVHRVAHVLIEQMLTAGYRVIYDATNLIEWHREKVYHLADRACARLVIICTIAPESVIRERLTQRFIARDPRDLSDANWDVFQALQSDQEPVRRPHLVVDTSGDIDAAVAKVLRAVR